MKALVATPLVALVTLPAAADRTAMLPLETGFYVDAGTACGNASNATLSLVHARGINSARTSCDFAEIRQRDATTYETVERCSEITGGAPFDTRVVYTVPEPRRYLFTNEHGWSGEARFCAQTELPDPWREIELPG